MEWKTIDSAPKDGAEVLVYVARKGGGNILSARNTTGTQWWAVGTGAVIATHWMPLPEPPNA